MVSKAERAAQEYRTTRSAHWDNVAGTAEGGATLGGYYHSRLRELYRFMIPAGARVLELGSGRGDLLAALEPAEGTGVDFSAEMVRLSRQRHPGLSFVQGDVHDVELSGTYDFIILSDLVNDLWDVQAVFRRVRALSHSRTRVVLNYYSHLWEQPLKGAQFLGLKKPHLEQNWLAPDDVSNLLGLEDFEVVREFREILCPLPLWPLHHLCNQFLVKMWPFGGLALTNFVIARPVERCPAETKPTVSVVVAARNEEGNIPEIMRRIPEMGGGTEIVFVEGGSKDDTFGAIEREIAANPQRRCLLFKQPGKGKGDAVRMGFEKASGDILMILDADMTVPPEDLPRFYEALARGKGEFINGVRLVYPMEEQAMRFLNLLGNKFFSAAFSWLLEQPIKDTLCGTKVLWKKDYEGIARNRSYFGDFDPFGDFDLLFGAAKLGLKIVQIPIRYRDRTYGETNISRFSHGALLLKMVVFAARKIKFR